MDQKQTQGQQKQGQDAGSNTERGGTDRDSTRNSETDGITNRDLDGEMDEQEELPDRGNSQSER